MTKISPILLSGFCLLFLGSCAEPYSARIKAPELTVVNSTGETIDRIVERSCDANDDSNDRVLARELKTGRSLVIPLAVTCSNLEAFNKEGRVVGRQAEVSTPPDLYWQIY
ncbi:hypothetical protein [Rheinheimera sp. 1928-s]|uniref:hypothetical protein n=1 Tax=Rheinheimera sp. 1928-s TaxID=3033803 RepID=UPI002602FEEC|nr:hypothetical protein [Rheinheimera sp. 1928-s]MDF3126991.1 hypothetical protein [Rheinheimera sp. 1928-s]